MIVRIQVEPMMNDMSIKIKDKLIGHHVFSNPTWIGF
jgi:hypothetical protein